MNIEELDWVIDYNDPFWEGPVYSTVYKGHNITITSIGDAFSLKRVGSGVRIHRQGFKSHREAIQSAIEYVNR